MDPFDFIPPLLPSLPGERSPQLTPGQRFAAGVGSTLLPAINFLLVLLAGFARNLAVAFLVMPLASAAAAFLFSRRLGTPLAWGLVPFPPSSVPKDGKKPVLLTLILALHFFTYMSVFVVVYG